MSAIVELGGKRFKRVEGSTVKHDFWLMAKVREAGVDKVQILSKKPEHIEQVIDTMIDRVIVDGHALTLLSGLLIPADLDPRQWTPEVSAETEEHLGQLTDVQDKTKIKPLIASMLSGFFMTGLASLQISPSSSSELEEDLNEPESATAGN